LVVKIQINKGVQFILQVGDFDARYDGMEEIILNEGWEERSRFPVRDDDDGCRYKFHFTVLGPTEIGRKVSFVTSKIASDNSNFQMMLLGLTDGHFPEDDFDDELFIGGTYRLKIRKNPQTGKPRLTKVEKVADPPANAAPAQAAPAPAVKATNGTAPAKPAQAKTAPTKPTTPAATPTAPAARKGPPPRKAKPDVPEPMRTAMFYVVFDNAEPVLLSAHEIQDRLNNEHHRPRVVDVCPEGGETWQTAEEAGFRDGVPFES
jgi:hypothetical protein